MEGNDYVIRALKTEHSIPSLGYALVEKPRPGRFNREKAVELGIPPGPLFAKLQKGNSVEINGKLVKPEDVMGPLETWKDYRIQRGYQTLRIHP